MEICSCSFKIGFKTCLRYFLFFFKKKIIDAKRTARTIEEITAPTTTPVVAFPLSAPVLASKFPEVWLLPVTKFITNVDFGWLVGIFFEVISEDGFVRLSIAEKVGFGFWVHLSPETFSEVSVILVIRVTDGVVMKRIPVELVSYFTEILVLDDTNPGRDENVLKEGSVGIELFVVLNVVGIIVDVVSLVVGLGVVVFWGHTCCILSPLLPAKIKWKRKIQIIIINTSKVTWFCMEFKN